MSEIYKERILNLYKQGKITEEALEKYVAKKIISQEEANKIKEGK